MNYVKPNGQYYEGDREHALDTEVPQRPDADHDWNGSTWEPDAAKVAEKQRKAAVAALADIDLRSIRALREYVASLPDAPEYVKDREAEAVVERGKLK